MSASCAQYHLPHCSLAHSLGARLSTLRPPASTLVALARLRDPRGWTPYAQVLMSFSLPFWSAFKTYWKPERKTRRTPDAMLCIRSLLISVCSKIVLGRYFWLEQVCNVGAQLALLLSSTHHASTAGERGQKPIYIIVNVLSWTGLCSHALPAKRHLRVGVTTLSIILE